VRWYGGGGGGLRQGKHPWVVCMSGQRAAGGEGVPKSLWLDCAVKKRQQETIRVKLGQLSTGRGKARSKGCARLDLVQPWLRLEFGPIDLNGW
jgi:hypothetical protein